MVQKIKQVFSNKRVRLILIGCIVCLFLSACSGKPPTFDRKEWTPDYNNCFPCKMYETAFSAVESTLGKLITISCQTGLTVLGFGLLFWMAFKVLSLFSVKEPNLKEFVHQVMVTFFKAMVVSSLIYSPESYIHFIGYYIIQPVFMFFTDISRTILLSDDFVAQSLITPADITGMKVEEEAVVSLFGEARNHLLDIIYRIFAGLYMGIGLSLTIMQQPGFVSTLFGFVIVLAFAFLLLIFPLGFVDAFIQLCAMLILSPFALVGWIFPPTKKILIKVWNVILGAMVNILFGCIYIALLTYVVLIFAEKSYPGILGSTRQTMDPMLRINVTTLASNFLGFFVLVISMAFLSGKIPQLAQQLTQTSVQSGGVFQALMQAGKLTYKGAKAAARGGVTIVWGIRDIIKILRG